MSTIVLSSEDEDECEVVDPDVPSIVQPPHTVFLLEDKPDNHLFNEDESEDYEGKNLDESSNLHLEEEPENILPESISSPLPTNEFLEDERSEEFISCTNDTKGMYQRFFDENTTDSANLDHNDVKNNVGTSAENSLKQENNKVFERLAKALTIALSSTSAIKSKGLSKKEIGDLHLTSEENIHFDATISKLVETNELLNKATFTSLSCSEGGVNHISLTNAANVKKRGRKPGWKKTPSNPSIQHNSVDNSTSNKKKRGRKPGWRKPEPNQCKEQVPIQDSSSNITKPKRKTSRKKSLKSCPSTEQVPIQDSSSNITKPERKTSRKKSLKSCPNGNAQVYSDQTTTSKKDEDKAGFNEIIKSDHCSKRVKGVGNTNPQENINKVSRPENEHNHFPGEKEPKDNYDSSKNGVEITTPTNLVSERGSTNSLKLVLESTLQYSTPYYDGLNTPIKKESLKGNQTFIENSIESTGNKLPEPNPSQNVQSKLTGVVEQDSALLKEDFIRCYNIIFDTNTECLSIKLGDVLLLTMNEVKHFSERIKSAENLSCGSLRDKEINITKTMFENTLSAYKSSFCSLFHDILRHILSNEEVIYQHKALLLALFLKMFIRVSTLSPEYVNSLILAKHAMTSLLKEYLLRVSKVVHNILHDTFWQSDIEFERNCWFILDFCLSSMPDQNYYSNNTLENTDKGITLRTVSQCLSDKIQSQADTSNNNKGVSVIVKNECYKDKLSSSTVEDQNVSSLHPDRQIINCVNNKTINSSKQCASTNFNITSGQYAPSNMNDVPPELVNKEILTNFSPKEQSFLDMRRGLQSFEGLSFRLSDAMQNHQQTTLDRMALDSQTINNDNTTECLAGIKRKAPDLEERSNKIAKPVENQSPVNLLSGSQQTIPTYTQALGTIGTLQEYTNNVPRQFYSSKPNSNIRRDFPPSYYSSKRTEFTTTPNSDNMPSKEQVPYSRPGTVPNANPQVNIQLQRDQLNSHTFGEYSGSFNKTVQNTSLPFERHNYYTTPNSDNMASKEQVPYSRPSTMPNANPQVSMQLQRDLLNSHTFGEYSSSFNKTIQNTSLPFKRHNYYSPNWRSQGQKNNGVGVHQTQNRPAAYSQRLSHYNQTSPYRSPYTTAYANYQPQNQTNSATPQYYQHPNIYGYNTYCTDPKLDVNGIETASEKPSNNGANMVAQNVCPSTLPQHMQSIKSDSGITINNYNINAYFPPTNVPTSQKVNSDSYISYGTTNTLTPATASKTNLSYFQ